MRLDEAKVILKENGYELLEEGKFGRALAAGALALSSLFGFSYGGQNQLNMRNLNGDYERIEKVVDKLKSSLDYNYCKIKQNGVICKYKSDLVIYPTNSIKSVEDNVSHIIFANNGNGDGVGFDCMVFSNVDGSFTDVHYIKFPTGKSIGYIYEYDEFDTIISKKELPGDSVKQMIQDKYNKIKNEIVR